MKRRAFIRNTAVAGAAAFVLPRFSIGQSGPSANSKMNIAMIGVGGIAGMAFDGCQDDNIVALCDIDTRKQPPRKKYPQIRKDVPYFQDFRVMLDKMDKEIDGVVINTPDHTHFVATLAAMERGLHVCTQKPLTHNIWEARTLQRAKDKYKVVTNMANQGHTYDGIRQMREMYEADLFGQVTEVHLAYDGPQWGSYFGDPKSMPLEAEPIPEKVDWDLWIGPAKDTVYNRMLHPTKWRSFWDYGTGMLGDWFCHIGDGPVWILDLYAPTVVECVERQPSLDGVIPGHSIVRFDFPARGNKAACSMYWNDGLRNGGKEMKKPEDWDWSGTAPKHGSLWFGDKANAHLNERSSNPRFAVKNQMRAYKESGGVEQKYARVEGGPFREWIRAVKGEGPEPGSNFDYAAPLSEICLLGALAQRVGGRIEWDAKNMQVTNRPELNAFIREPVRSGWEMGADLWS
ncbi:MAG: Gfo/Idh/MocA family oxidoreductase [Puniceicoccaceae bacterium]|jgi:predicted dehydrogenase|nr:Gfo/Idh/MocA family oxidoreductase [Puniceicoccaceae bacterium]